MADDKHIIKLVVDHSSDNSTALSMKVSSPVSYTTKAQASPPPPPPPPKAQANPPPGKPGKG